MIDDDCFDEEGFRESEQFAICFEVQSGTSKVWLAGFAVIILSGRLMYHLCGQSEM